MPSGRAARRVSEGETAVGAGGGAARRVRDVVGVRTAAVDGAGAADQGLAAGLGDLVRAFGPGGRVDDAVPVIARAGGGDGEVDVA